MVRPLNSKVAWSGPGDLRDWHYPLVSTSSTVTGWNGGRAHKGRVHLEDWGTSETCCYMGGNFRVRLLATIGGMELSSTCQGCPVCPSVPQEELGLEQQQPKIGDLPWS